MDDMTYWEKRTLDIEEQAFKKASDSIKLSQKVYKKALKNIENKIYIYTMKFADANGKMSYQKAKKVLNKGELDDFKLTVEEYVELSKKNPISKSSMLLNSSLKYRIDRLTALKVEIEKELSELAYKQEQITKNILDDVYKDVYVKTAYLNYEMSGIGKHIASLSSETVNSAIREAWTSDGNNFSNRIWKNSNKMKNELYTLISKNIALGQSPYNFSRELRSYITNKDKYGEKDIARLLESETSAIRSKAAIDSYKDTGVEEYQIVTTLDEKICKGCSPWDKKVLPVNDAIRGVNINPFHPRCRCSSAPYYEDNVVKERSARDITGTDKNKEIKALDFENWKNKYVGSDKFDYLHIADKNLVKDKEQYARYVNLLGKEKAGETVDIFQEMKYTNSNKYKELKTLYSNTKEYNYTVDLFKNHGVPDKYIPQTIDDFIDIKTNDQINYNSIMGRRIIIRKYNKYEYSQGGQSKHLPGSNQYISDIRKKINNIDYFEKSYFGERLEFDKYKNEILQVPETKYMKELKKITNNELIFKIKQVYSKYSGKGEVKYNYKNPKQIREYIIVPEDEIKAWDVKYSKKESNQTLGQTIMYGDKKYHITPNGLHLK